MQSPITKGAATAIIWAVSTCVHGQEVEPLPRAHAHNDYWHDRPLTDALEHGFCSVEADVFAVREELLVGHAREELQPDRTLMSLYLDPLYRRVASNGGRVYRDGPEFTLLVDIKSDAEATYRVLQNELTPYQGMLTRLEQGEVRPGAVRIIISGNRPTQWMASESSRNVFVDGRLVDLQTNPPLSLVPLISDRWASHFQWSGEGELRQQDAENLRRFVKAAHDQGRQIRFWAVPDTPPGWQALWQADVDLINTDRLAELSAWLRAKESPQR